MTNALNVLFSKLFQYESNQAHSRCLQVQIISEIGAR